MHVATSLRRGLFAFALLASASCAFAQGSAAPPAAADLVKATAAAVTVAAGSQADVVVHLQIADGWHVNANPPALDYNIPTTVTIAGGGGLSGEHPHYPAPKKEKFSFDESELWVWDGGVDVRVPLAAAPDATPGTRTLHGTVQFQSCNNEVCLAPAKVPFDVAVNVTAAAPGTAPAAGSTPPSGAAIASTDSTPSASAGFATAAPPGAAKASSPEGKLASLLAHGGLGWFVALFVGGLLLNLTPCVFPMLGITVSIFGARRKEPVGKVVTYAALYVLGICVMYSALGVIAPLTGHLFGAALANVWVSVGLGMVILVLSLSMFGLYELQPPAWVLDRLGGAQATSALGTFLSGLGVGIIAAPCVGPFVVAVLALIAQRGDWAFGLRTMFTLSLGLGFPYLFLAAFSGLLQTLPRSGEWMVWVKKFFGVVMASLGLDYLLVGIAPRFVPWVLPSALLLGALYLGFMEKSSNDKRGFRTFKQVLGVLGAAAGVLSALLLVRAQSRTLEFAPYDEKAVAASVAAGRPVLLDFSADWCVPCHELELQTFTDARVVSAAREFDRYKVDLTAYDSDAASTLRQRYSVAGVPTVLFLRASGGEAREARVVGYVPADVFLQRIAAAAVR